MLKCRKLITFHYSRNYGAFLQCYALHRKAEADVVDFIPPWKFFVGFKTKFCPLVGLLLGVWRRYRSQARFDEMKRMSLSKYGENGGTCIYIAGSDQIWNPRCIKNFTDIYFLNFLNDNVKRISYAASLGMKRWPKNFEQEVIPMLRKFSAISVRECSSVNYLTSLGFEKVVWVCDPTILYDGKFYRSEFHLENPIKESFVFVYKIRENVPTFVNEILEQFEIIRIVDLARKRTICSVTEWLSDIDCSNFVVTDSFHCAVFCILFHKSFIVLANHGSGEGMNERFQSLLGKTSLLYRILPQETTRDDALERLNRPIDWQKIDAIMEEWRTYSSNWLKKALEK